MGVAVFSGMIGVTFFGLLLTPVFFTTLRKLSKGKQHAVLSPESPEVAAAPAE